MREQAGFAILFAVGVAGAIAITAAPRPAPRAAAPRDSAIRSEHATARLVESLRAEPPFHDVALESPEALAPLRRALAQIDRGEPRVARIAIYGGSHTAGDLYTGQLREILQGRYGDAGHGFVSVAPVVVAHWAWGVVIEAEGFGAQQVGFKHRAIDRYGLAGVVFSAVDEGAYATVASDTWGNGRYASHLELLYDRGPDGGSFDVTLDGVVRDRVDSYSHEPASGRLVYDVSDGPHRLETRTLGDGTVRLFGVVMEREGPGVIVDNLGLVGSKARHQLLWDETQWREYAELSPPDLFALAYGNNETNDSHLLVRDHERHLRAVLTRMRSTWRDAGCLLIGPTDRPRLSESGDLITWPIVEEINEMIRHVAADEGCAFFDTLAFQGGLGAGIGMLRHDPPLMREDRQHLSREAYLAWGTALARAILEAVQGS
ncbi:MAG: GDSL-type esterase/lipase family protein [Sandaracinaceae bacterium]